MNKYTKAGLTALAGSLVAVSAAQADWSVSGSGKMAYVTKGGTADRVGAASSTGSGFGMDKDITVSGSMEMDNGWAVSTSHTLDNGAGSNSAMTVDMGAMGSLTYNMVDGDIGIGKIDDMMPSADEEVTNGLSDAGDVATAATGFHYSLSVEGVSITAGYSPNGEANATQTGGQSGAGKGASEQSFTISGSPTDGLTVGYGIGDGQNATDITKLDSLDTVFATYAYGPVTVGYQMSTVDYNAAGGNDVDSTRYSVAYAINDDLSISYGVVTNDIAGVTADEEMSGFSIGYSMGGMTVKAHTNKQDNRAGTTTADYDHTEIAVSFAF
jgi:outer membrane protein OmpU